jgi:poly(3-hydroxybutyrate) depolymerase
MIRRIHIILICAFVGVAMAKPMPSVSDFGENPGKLRMFIHLPETLDPQEPAPLVLILHGSGQTANVLADASGFNKLADSLGFIALYPDQPFYNNLLTSFSFYMPGKMKKDQGENASIRQMITYACEHYNINEDMIYITGMSAGAAMANVMLNAYPRLFRAGALFAAPSQLYEEINPDRNPELRIAIIHGIPDLTVPFRHAETVTKQWLTYFGLKDDPFVEDHYLDDPQLRLKFWPKEGLPQVVRLELLSTGHILLVDIGKGLKQGGQYTLFTQDKDFHLPFWICEFFGLTPE